MSSPEEHDRKQPPPYLDPGLIIDTRLREVEKQQSEDRAEQKQHSRAQLSVNKYIAGFTGLLFLTSLVSDLMLQKQISVAKESADAARSAAMTADESLKITKALTEGTSEAIAYGTVDCRNFKDGICHFSFVNVGHVAAKKLHAHIEFSIRAIDPSSTQIGKTYVEDIDQPELVPRITGSDPMYAPGHGDIDRVIDVPIYKLHRAEIEHGKTGLMVNIVLSYDNGFGTQKSSPHCEENVYMRTGPSPTTRVPTIVPCEGPFGIESIIEQERKMDLAAKQQDEKQNPK